MFEDGLGLFEGLDAFVGDFTDFEQSQPASPIGAPHDREAGRDPGEPAFVAFGLGRRDRDPLRHPAVGPAAERVGAQRRGAAQ